MHEILSEFDAALSEFDAAQRSRLSSFGDRRSQQALVVVTLALVLADTRLASTT